MPDHYPSPTVLADADVAALAARGASLYLEYPAALPGLALQHTVRTPLPN